MSDDYLNLVECSIKSIFGAMAGIELKPGEFQKKCHEQAPVGESVSSVISLSGSGRHFSMSLTFPESVIIAITQKMLPEVEVSIGHPMVSDLAGELANMVLGSTKNTLDPDGNDLSLSLPVVVSGNDYQIEHKTSSPVWVAKMCSELGEIFVEVSQQNEVDIDV